MFEGVPDQFHQSIASRTSLPLPLSFHSLHGFCNTTTFPSFDPYSITSTSSHQQVPLLHPLHQGSSPTTKNDQDKEENSNMVVMNLEIQPARSIPESVDPSWSNDEVLALLRIRSSMENWSPEFTWEHVSRKLAELGFKRSGEKCKEKFDEESRYFNNNINYNKNTYRVFCDFDEEIYHHHQNPHEVAAEMKDKKMDNNMASPEEEEEEDSRNVEQTIGKETEDIVTNIKEVAKSKRGKKRNREKKFEMLKCFCAEIVKKIISQQEEMHNKLLEDMVKRDEEKFAREEARKKQEMDRINKELEVRAQEQALVADRHATIIKFLRKFTGSSSDHVFFREGNSAQDLGQLDPTSTSSNPSTSSSSLVLGGQNPNPTFRQTKAQHKHKEPPTSLAGSQTPQNPSSTLAPNIIQALAPQNPNSLKTQNNPSMDKEQTKSKTNEKEGLGKKWPKDEVLALIDLRCNLYNNNEDKEGAAAKTPLWERISQEMLELGYKRSAKRCKEKWENINKYFRKTKDVNKKRSIDSRTCPYFHQLSTLYNQGVLISPSDKLENRPD